MGSTRPAALRSCPRLSGRPAHERRCVRGLGAESMRGSLGAALFVLIAGGGVDNAQAGDAHAGFKVSVHVLQPGRAASVPKSGSSASRASGRAAAFNELRLNVPTRAGYVVRFEILDPAVQGVEIRGLGPAIQ